MRLPLKDCERQERESTFPYEIKGPGRRRPSNWALSLKNVSSKTSLVQFLIEIWKDDAISNIHRDKTLYANYNNVCHDYNSENGQMKYCEAEEYYSSRCWILYENNIAAIEKFVCAMYGKQKIALVDEVRSDFFR